MMKQILNLTNFKIWLLLCTIILAVGCSKKDEDPTLNTIKLDRASIKFRDNKSAVVNIQYSDEWLAELEDDSWCELDKTSGTGNGAIQITVKANTEPKRLVTTLTIKSKSNPLILETVRLSMDGISFVVDPVNIEFGLGETYYDLDIDYEGQWTASLDNQSWCSLDVSSGTGKSTIRITNKNSIDQIVGNTAKLRISPVEYPGLSTFVEIKQSDNFKHGSYLTLNKATVGKGIDIVILGDGFMQNDMKKNGHWHTVAKRTKEVLFALEPYKSFLNHFNVYMVNAVSEGNVIGKGRGTSNTFFKAYLAPEMANVLYLEDGSKASNFAYENSPVKIEKGSKTQMFYCVMVNDPSYRGAASIVESGGSYLGTIFDLGDRFKYIVTHEFTHAFAKLADEYKYSNLQFDIIPSKEVNTYMLAKNAFGYYQNVEFTADRTKFFNQNWRKLLDMQYPGVSVIEGGFYYPKGVWISEPNGLMNSNTNDLLGPVNREIVLRQIYKLSGRSAEYSFQTFLDYDKRNL